MNAYICHYSPLNDRKKHIEKEISKIDFITDHEFVEFEPSEDFIGRHYRNSELIWRFKVSGLDYGSFIPFRELSKSEISLLYKHYIIYEKIVNSPDDYSFVFEDDIIVNDNFNRINLSDKNVLDFEWDFIFLGNGCGLRIPEFRRRDGKIFYRKDHPASKCTDSYIIKKDAAKKVLNDMRDFSLPIDFELNHIMRKNNMKAYWVDPPIIGQGSQNNIFKSSIN